MNGARPLRAEAVTPAQLGAAVLGRGAIHVLSESPEATRRLAATMAGMLKAGETVLLCGDLGAGKTTFAKGFCESLGVREKVTSPTFTLMHVYRGTAMTVYHFDFYRLESVQEIAALGVEEYFGGDGLCLVEWPERALPLLPRGAVRVRLSLPDYRDQPTVRMIEISRHAP